MNIANGLELNSNEVISNRIEYYMGRIGENSQSFNEIQESMYTQYKSLISLD